MRLHYLLPFILFASFQLVLAQPPNTTGIDYTTELQKSAGVPNSPEAQAFTQYGNTSVSLYTGQPQISVPLHQYQGRELSLPMSLTYDASGIKVTQLATQTGLGWNLRFGGRISRIVNGQPDDFNYSSVPYLTISNPEVRAKILEYSANNTTFSSIARAEEYLIFLKDMSKGLIDAQPDYYSLNVLGINATIAFDVSTMKPIVLNNPRIKAELIGGSIQNGWTITGEDGTIYTFSKIEVTRYEGNDFSSPAGSPEIYGLTKNYNSSWLLTRIVSPTGKDDYQFNYISLGEWSDFHNYTGAVSITNSSCDDNYIANTYPINFGEVSWFQPKYKIDQLFLSEVSHNGRKIFSFDLEERYDVSIPSALASINIHSPGNASDIIKELAFDYSYFGISDSQNPALESQAHIRLKLDKLAVKGEGQTGQTYRFEYHNADQLPSRESLSRDYLGYYNGRNNEVLYPPMQVGQDYYEGGNLTPSRDKTKIGSLKRLYYPTGGYTEFTYGLPSITKVFTPGPVITNGNIGGNTIVGGRDDSNINQCNIACQDKYGHPPKISHTTFSVNKAGTFRLDYSTTGGVSEAHLVRLSGPNDRLQYHEIIDDLDRYAVPYLWDYRVSGSSNGIIPFFKNLEVGHYQITLVNAGDNHVTNVQVYGDYIQQQPSREVTEYKAGQRIEKITDYTSENQVASIREYKYTTGLDNGVSSAKVVFEPVLRYSTVRQALLTDVLINECGYGDGINTMRYEHRVTRSSGGDQPHIAYHKVFEIRKTRDNNSTEHEGYTEYNFHVGRSGLVSTGVPPNASSYYINHDFGKEKEIMVYNQDDQLLQKNSMVHDGSTYFTTQGLYATFREENTYAYPQIFYNSHQQKYQIRYVNPDLYRWAGAIISGPLGTDPPSSCDLPENTCLNNFDLGPYGMGITGAAGTIDYTIEVETNEYIYEKDGTPRQIDTKTEMDYDPAVDYLNTAITTYGSEDEVIVERKYYPKHFDTYPYTALQDANRLNMAVEEEMIKNGTEILHRKVDYDLNNGQLQPHTLAFANGGALEDRIAYRYDNDQNLTEAIQISDPAAGAQASDLATTYLWGYNKKFMVAQIENATASQVEMALGAGNNLLEQELPNEDALILLFNTLREALPQARITSYTHQYGAGISTVTDPNGIVSRYEYDALNRLIAIYIADEKIREFDYQYLTEE